MKSESGFSLAIASQPFDVQLFKSEAASPVLNISSPSDTLQYLSQLESVARKLKDQLIRQNQVIVLEKTGLIITCLVFNQRKCKQKWLNPHCWCPSHIFHPLQLQKFVNCTKLLSLEVPSISIPKAPSISVIQPNLLTYSRGWKSEWFKCFRGSRAVRGIYRGWEFSWSDSNVGLSVVGLTIFDNNVGLSRRTSCISQTLSPLSKHRPHASHHLV